MGGVGTGTAGIADGHRVRGAAETHDGAGENDMMEKKTTASQHVLDHVGRAATHLNNFHRDGATSEGVLRNPKIQATALKMARVELEKAIAIIERTKW
jgi:hypothetical protein